jgi:hypothetical protein
MRHRELATGIDRCREDAAEQRLARVRLVAIDQREQRLADERFRRQPQHVDGAGALIADDAALVDHRRSGRAPAR